jgi:hypothetical protein
LKFGIRFVPFLSPSAQKQEDAMTRVERVATPPVYTPGLC